jgi:NitT/TauT family transport system substrate-binding protein
MSTTRRTLLVAGLAMPAILRSGSAAHAAEPVVVRMGVLKLIHSITPYFYERFVPAGYRVEIVAFESPTDGKDAVVTKSVDFGTFGVAAAVLASTNGQPLVIVGSECNKGMAVVARADGPVHTLKDLTGKRVAIWPGSTQEVFIRDRLRMEGMAVSDIHPVRVSFSEMHAALARGDVDAYVGAEPAPAISVTTGVGRIVEYPYSTPMGSLNMILATHADTAKTKPDLVRMMVNLQREASQFAMAHTDELVAMTVAKLGQKKEAIAMSVSNVELNWRMTPEMIAQAKTYAQQMLELKEIKKLPDFTALLDPKFSDEVAQSA